jgi:hypothetical protein
VVVSTERIFLFSRNLLTKDLNVEDGIDQHLFLMNDTNGNLIGEFVFHINGLPNSTFQRIWIDVTHFNDTLLDSVTFKFSTAPGKLATVYHEAGYPTVPTTTSRDTHGTTIDFKPINGYARSTFTCRFVLENTEFNQISLKTEVTMHQQQLLQLTSLRAEMYIQNILPSWLQ